ncbi:uncharacterized protein [Aphelocoma coerulescens]|uniref:uncharacterized protein n=1 Tax=Aphelocoma coerulescens TaxID=39617 RepID=UPI0036052ADE
MVEHCLKEVPRDEPLCQAAAGRYASERQQVVPKPGIRNRKFAWTGERRPVRQDQPGGEDAPGPARRMEALAKVVSQIHKQWGIDCKPKDFTLAVARLLEIGVIDRPVDILHPEVWDKCTKALADETMSSGSGKYLKLWGKVVQALRKALQEQETWKAARNCLLATPRLGVGAATQTTDESSPAERTDSQEQAPSPRPPSPTLTREGKERAQSFWGGLVEEAREAAIKAESETAWARPPPYALQNGADPGGDGGGCARGRRERRRCAGEHTRGRRERRRSAGVHARGRQERGRSAGCRRRA